ncbi:MAG: autotransporter outer membrane beta-barrel domain-containing protein, partial [Geminicoccaceae bacterium]
RQTRLSLVGAFGWNDNDSERTIDFGGLDRTAEADFDSWHAIASIELLRFYRLSKNLGLQPSLSATYVYAEAEDYSKTGADADSLDLGVTGRVI